MKNTRIFPMRRLPGPASSPLCDGVKTPEAPVELFRGWQRTQTQSSVRTLRGLRQQMDVWFCLMQESSAERHRCVTADPDQTNCAPSGARPEILCFSLDFDLHRCGLHFPLTNLRLETAQTCGGSFHKRTPTIRRGQAERILNRDLAIPSSPKQTCPKSGWPTSHLWRCPRCGAL